MYRVSDELQKEANMYKLHHDNIVTLFAIILEPPHSDVPGHYGIVMEYVLHGSLKEFLLNHNV